MNSILRDLNTWSLGSNLALNPSKTKCMLFSASQMSTYYSLESRQIHLTVGGKQIEHEKSTKLLGVHLNDSLKWDDHINSLATSCYSTLSVLRKIKNFTSYKSKKIFS